MPKSTPAEVQSNADRCLDGKPASGPQLDAWQANAIAEAYSPDQLKVRTVAGPTKQPLVAWSEEITRAGAGSRVTAGNGAIVVAEAGSQVNASGKSAVVAQANSEVRVSCPAKAVAEAGSVVFTYNGARVDAKPGANVLDYLPSQGTALERYATRSGTTTEVYAKTYGIDRLYASKDSTLITDRINTIAQPGSSVIVQARGEVLAEPGSTVQVQRDALAYTTPGANVIRERGAKVIEARGYLGPENAKNLYEIKPGGQLRYYLTGMQHLEVPSGASVLTEAPSVVAKTGSSVSAFGKDQLNIQQVVVESGANAEVGGRSHVRAQSGSNVKVSGEVVAEALPGSVVVADQGGTVIAEAGSKVVAGYNSKVLAKPGSDVRARTGASVQAQKGAHVEYDHMVDRIRDAFN